MALYWLCSSVPSFLLSVLRSSQLVISVLQVSLFSMSLDLWHYCAVSFVWIILRSLLIILLCHLNPCSSNCFLYIFIWLFWFRLNSSSLPNLFPLFLISVDVIAYPNLYPFHDILSVANIFWSYFNGIAMVLSVPANSSIIPNVCWCQGYNRLIKWVG